MQLIKMTVAEMHAAGCFRQQGNQVFAYSTSDHDTAAGYLRCTPKEGDASAIRAHRHLHRSLSRRDERRAVVRVHFSGCSVTNRLSVVIVQHAASRSATSADVVRATTRYDHLYNYLVQRLSPPQSIHTLITITLHHSVLHQSPQARGTKHCIL